MRRQAGAPLFYFYKERLGTGSPPHPTRLRRPTFPPRGRLWVEKNLASQTSGPRKGRNKIQSVFCTDMCRAKNSSHPESASFAGAVRGASPNFGSPAQRVPKFLPHLPPERHKIQHAPHQQGGPPPPWVRGRSLPLAGFGVVGRSGTVEGLIRYPSACPDLGRFFV